MVIFIVLIIFVLVCMGYLLNSSKLSDSDSNRLNYLREKIKKGETLTSQEKIDYFFLNIKVIIAIVCFIAVIYFGYSFYKIFNS